MFGFLGKGKGKAGQQNGQPVQTTSATSSNMFSSQAAAALAAAAAAGNVPGNAGPAPTGRRLQGTDVTVDLDALRPGEKVPELQVCVQSRSAAHMRTAAVARWFQPMLFGSNTVLRPSRLQRYTRIMFMPTVSLSAPGMHLNAKPAELLTSLCISMLALIPCLHIASEETHLHAITC